MFWFLDLFIIYIHTIIIIQIRILCCLVLRFHSLLRSPISGGKSVTLQFPEMFSTERLVSSLMKVGIILMLLLLMSSMLRLLNISLVFGLDSVGSSSDTELALSGKETWRLMSLSGLLRQYYLSHHHAFVPHDDQPEEVVSEDEGAKVVQPDVPSVVAKPS